MGSIQIPFAVWVLLFVELQKLFSLRWESVLSLLRGKMVCNHGATTGQPGGASARRSAQRTPHGGGAICRCLPRFFEATSFGVSTLAAKPGCWASLRANPYSPLVMQNKLWDPPSCRSLLSVPNCARNTSANGVTFGDWRRWDCRWWNCRWRDCKFG